MQHDILPEPTFSSLRDSPELPWSDVTGDAEVTLIVGRTVQKELEKKKYELRGGPGPGAHLRAEAGRHRQSGGAARSRENGPRVLLDFVPRPTDGPHRPTSIRLGRTISWLPTPSPTCRQPRHSRDDPFGDAGVVANARGHGVGVATPGEKGWDLPPRRRRRLRSSRSFGGKMRNCGERVP